MALCDPGLLEFARLVNTEESATEFARELGLLLSDQALNNNLIGAVSCVLESRGALEPRTQGNQTTCE